MKKNFLNIVFVSSLLFAASATIITSVYKTHKNEIHETRAKSGYAPGYTPSKTYTFGDGATYYNGISESQKGMNY